MASLEDRLRSELREIAGGADHESLRPLRVPVRRRRRRLARWLAPVAAMAAVAGLIAGAHLVRFGGRPDSSAATAAMPPYYVTVGDASADQRARGPLTATVHASATGAVRSSVQLPSPPASYPAGQLFFETISGAADDRTFLIQDVHDLLVLSIGPDGRSPWLRKLPVTLPPTASVALSPDGTTAAIESMSSCGSSTRLSESRTDVTVCRQTQLQLVSLQMNATTRTWRTGTLAAQGTWVSWTRPGQILFLWPGTGAPSGPASLRLLGVASRSGNLLAAQVLPVRIQYDPLYPVPYAFMAPDGSAIISPTVSNRSGVSYMQVVEYSASTGSLQKVLAHYRGDATGAHPAGGCEVLSLASAGFHALAMCATPSIIFGRVDNGRFTPLPGITSPSGAAAW